MKELKTFPTLLTLIRLIISPLLLPALIIHLLPINNIWINGALAILFLLFGLTDFFDGFLARKYSQVTTVGRILDPIADKFLMFSTLIALVTIHKIFFLWAIVLIGREFFILGLRQLSLESGFILHVSWLAKLKTLAQMAYLAFIIYNPYHTLDSGLIKRLLHDFCVAPGWTAVELLLGIAAVATSLISAHQYYRLYLDQVRQKERSMPGDLTE